MKIRGISMIILALLLPQQLGATSIDFFAIIFTPGRPTVTDTLTCAAQDIEWVEKAITHDLQLIRRVPQIKYQITGTTDGRECIGAECHELALRRANLFQAALVQAGALTEMFCQPKAVNTPWPSTYTPKSDDLEMGRRAFLEPVFNGCA